MKISKDHMQKELDALPLHYKTSDVDRLINTPVKQNADVVQPLQVLFLRDIMTMMRLDCGNNYPELPEIRKKK